MGIGAETEDYESIRQNILELISKIQQCTPNFDHLKTLGLDTRHYNEHDLTTNDHLSFCKNFVESPVVWENFFIESITSMEHFVVVDSNYVAFVADCSNSSEIDFKLEQQRQLIQSIELENNKVNLSLKTDFSKLMDFNFFQYIGVPNALKKFQTEWDSRNRTNTVNLLDSDSLHDWLGTLLVDRTQPPAMVIKGDPRVIKSLLISNWLRRMEDKLEKLSMAYQMTKETTDVQKQKSLTNDMVNEMNKLAESVRMAEKSISKVIRRHKTNITEVRVPLVNFHSDYNWEVFEVQKKESFRCQVTLTGDEKRLLFRYKNMEGKLLYVSVIFPSKCLLGERRVHLELVFPNNFFELREKEILITPVVFISLEKHTHFLRRVEIELPITEKNFELQEDCTVLSNFRKELTINNQCTATIRAFDFSPAAVIKKITSVSIASLF